ncbi:ArsR/SmtB family transcription factor [Rubrivirga sp.]|uniref:ArsR/SmtB family transcription factor n=1 Tax=Rubrivirga sp. TaxID=1885344 RepID=UPI003C7589DB
MADPSLVPTDLLEAAAARFRLLGDPTRLRLLRSLYGAEEMDVQSLADETGQSHANTSKHLRQLAQAGVVDGRRDGLHVYYRITDPTLQRLCDLVCDALEDG